MQILADEQLGFNFGARSESNGKKLNVFSSMLALVSFGDIGRNGNRCPSQLR